MRDFAILLGLTIVFMVGVIAGFFYLWYEHNALIRKVQSLEYQLEEHDGLISQNIDYVNESYHRILDIEKHIGIDINVCDGCLVDDCQGCPYIEKSIVTMDRNEKNIEG